MSGYKFYFPTILSFIFPRPAKMKSKLWSKESTLWLFGVIFQSSCSIYSFILGVTKCLVFSCLVHWANRGRWSPSLDRRRPPSPRIQIQHASPNGFWTSGQRCQHGVAGREWNLDSGNLSPNLNVILRMHMTLGGSFTYLKFSQPEDQVELDEPWSLLAQKASELWV